MANRTAPKKIRLRHDLRSVEAVVIVCLLCLFATRARAQDVSVVPEPDHVIREVRGQNELDTAARQLAALRVIEHDYLEYFYRTLKEKADDPKIVDAEIKKYKVAIDDFSRIHIGQEFRELTGHYFYPFSDSPTQVEFRKEIYARFLSSEHYAAFLKAREQRREAGLGLSGEFDDAQSGPPSWFGPTFLLFACLTPFALSLVFFGAAAYFGVRSNSRPDTQSEIVAQGFTRYLSMIFLVLGLGFLMVAVVLGLAILGA